MQFELLYILDCVSNDNHAMVNAESCQSCDGAVLHYLVV